MSSFEDKIPAISSLLRETISLKWLCLLNDTKVSENVSCFLKLFSNSPSSQSKNNNNNSLSFNSNQFHFFS